MTASASANVVGHVAAITVMLYVIIFFPVFKTNPMTTLLRIFWSIIALVELSVAANGAI